jgi:thiamine monophosphate synthase
MKKENRKRERAEDDSKKNRNKRVTIYLQPEFHRALRVKAAETEYSVSKIVNDAVRLALAEDAIDLEATEARKNDPLLDFEEVVKALKRDGKL